MTTSQIRPGIRAKIKPGAPGLVKGLHGALVEVCEVAIEEIAGGSDGEVEIFDPPRVRVHVLIVATRRALVLQAADPVPAHRNLRQSQLQ